MHLLKYLLYSGCYFVKRQVFRQKIPFIGGLVLNESCNLSCPHCHVGKLANRQNDMSFSESCNGIDALYARGVRNLAITGGEPFFWKSGSHDVREVILYARKKGFHAISVYTNGTLPFDCDADTVFVSIDGVAETNDTLRGCHTFAKVMRNLDASSHHNIIINFTINRLNSQDIRAVCKLVQDHPKLGGIFFYFHTPYYGVDELFQTLEQKRPIVDQIMQFKRNGFPICNSTASLRSFYADTWKRPSDLCIVYSQGKFSTCCRSISNGEGCQNCGYLGYSELQEILKLKPSAIRAGLRYISNKTGR